MLLYASTDKKAIDWQVFLMVIQENPNKSYPPMRVLEYPLITLEYSIIRQKIIHSFKLIHFSC